MVYSQIYNVSKLNNKSRANISVVLSQVALETYRVSSTTNSSGTVKYFSTTFSWGISKKQIPQNDIAILPAYSRNNDSGKARIPIEDKDDR